MFGSPQPSRLHLAYRQTMDGTRPTDILPLERTVETTQPFQTHVGFSVTPSLGIPPSPTSKTHKFRRCSTPKPPPRNSDDETVCTVPSRSSSTSNLCSMPAALPHTVAEDVFSDRCFRTLHSWTTSTSRQAGTTSQTGPPTCLQSLINAEGTLPYAYILPKPSKAFEKARPIISYMLSWNAKLGQLVGTLVYELCRSIFGDMQLDRTVQDIITDIQKIFDNIPNHIELDLQQQDLSGFFNSVPHARMIEAVTYAVNHYIAHKGVAPDSKLSTSLAMEDRTQRIFRGRFRRAGQKYLAIQLNHIPKITEFLLKHSYFTVGGMVFRQIQGASMGSHFAPALCGLVAAFQEYCFHKF